VRFGSSVTLFVSTGRRSTTESTAPRTNRDRPAAPEETANAPAPRERTAPERKAPERKGRGNGRGKD
jgi:hypothetical protein